jgi:hypothetical protein
VTGPPSGPLGPPTSARLRSWRRPAAVLAAVLLLALAIGLVAGSGNPGYLDPDSAAPTGARALRVLLQQQGVHVNVVASTAAAVSAAGRGETLLVADAALLSDSQLAQVRGTAADLVVTDPDPRVVAELAPGLTAVAGQPVGLHQPRCAVDVAVLAGDAQTGALAISGQPQNGSVQACYPTGAGASLAVVSTAGGRSVTLLGSGQSLTNGQFGQAGNASLAMGLLGAAPQLVWYVASTEVSAQGGSATLGQLLPQWVGLLLAQLLVLVVVLAVWQGRRLGPLVSEPLPVHVRAAETTEGRARLYQKVHARARAAQNLRAAAVARLTAALGLPRHPEPGTVSVAVAARAGLPADGVLRVLYGPPPRDDAALVRLADDLDALERQVSPR